MRKSPFPGLRAVPLPSRLRRKSRTINGRNEARHVSEWSDVDKKSMRGTQKFGCEMTILKGAVQWDLNARASDAWDAKAR